MILLLGALALSAPLQPVIQSGHERSVRRGAVSASGAWLLTESVSTLYLWQVASGRQVRTFRPVHPPQLEVNFDTGLGVAFIDQTDENQFFWGGEVFDATTGKALYSLPVESVTRDGRTAFGISGIYDVRTRKLVKKLGKTYQGCIKASPTALSVDRKYLALVCEGSRGDRDVQKWNMVVALEGDRKVRDFFRSNDEHRRPGLRVIEFLQDGKNLLAVDHNGHLQVVDIESGTLVYNASEGQKAALGDEGRGTARDGFALSPSGRWLYVSGYNKQGRYVGVHDLSSYKLAQSTYDPRAGEGIDATERFYFATGNPRAKDLDDERRRVTLYDRLQGLAGTASIGARTDFIDRLEFTSNTTFSTASLGQDVGIRHWDLAHGRQLGIDHDGSLTTAENPVYFATIDRTVSPSVTQLRRRQDGKIIYGMACFKADTCKVNVWFSADNRRAALIVSEDNFDRPMTKLNVVDTTSGKLLYADETVGAIEFLSFSPDGDAMMVTKPLEPRKRPHSNYQDNVVIVFDLVSLTERFRGPKRDEPYRLEMSWKRGTPLQFWAQRDYETMFGSTKIRTYAVDPAAHNMGYEVRLGTERMGHTGSPFGAKHPRDNAAILEIGTGLNRQGFPSGANLELINGDTGRVIWTIVTKGHYLAEAFAPKGDRLAVEAMKILPDDDNRKISTIWLYDSKTGRQIPLAPVTPYAEDVKMRFSDDGTRLLVSRALGATNNEVSVFDIYDAQTGKRLGASKQIARPWCLAWSPDNRYVATASRQEQVRLFDGKTAEFLASFAALRDEDYAVSTAEQYYIASRGAAGALHYVDGRKLYTFENFDLLYNRPDLVMQKIGAAPQADIDAALQAYQKRLRRMGIKPEQIGANLVLPTVTLLSAKNESGHTTDASVTFKVRAEGNAPLDRINVLANDVPVFGSAGLSLTQTPTTRIEREITVPLASGRNRIHVSVLSSTGFESLRETIELTRDGVSSKPDLYVIAIGASEYQQSNYNLSYAAKDAGDIATQLQMQRGAFANVKVQRLLNKEVTRDAIKTLRDGLTASKVDDVVAVFYAGHGLLDAKLDYFLATNDVDFEHPELAAIPYEDFEALLDGIPARKKLLILDACHAGEVDKEENQLVATVATTEGKLQTRGLKPSTLQPKLGARGTTRLMEDMFSDLRRGSGSIVMSSAAGSERALESDQWRNGVFTYALLEGLKTKRADRDKNGHVDTRELREYVGNKVKELTAGQQTPTARRASLEFEFFVD